MVRRPSTVRTALIEYEPSVIMFHGSNIRTFSNILSEKKVPGQPYSLFDEMLP